MKIQVGNDVKKFREQNNLTQFDLANLLGVSMSCVSKVEQSRNKKLTLYFLKKWNLIKQRK